MRRAILGFPIVLMLLATVPSAHAQTTFPLVYYDSLFYWRAGGSYSGPWGDWSLRGVYRESFELTLIGNTLHRTFNIIGVGEPQGGSTVYTYDRNSDRWIMHGGLVKYKYPPRYGDYTVTNYFRGYLKFNVDPSATTFLHGVEYQWIYVYVPRDQEASVKAVLPHAVWDEVMQAWLVGFTVYVFDPSVPSIPYNVPFQFVEPVPANNYNPLNL